MKSFRVMISVMVLIHFFASCGQKAEPETYLIPADFTGAVNIIFSRADGSPGKYEEGRRVYEIPSSGILLTQLPTNDGFTDRKYYYKEKSGALKLLQKFAADTTMTKTIDRNEVGIFLDGTSGMYGNIRDRNSLKFQTFVVSSYNSLDSFFTEAYNNFFYSQVEKISGLKIR